MFVVFLGIGEFEKIIVLFGWILIWWCVLLVIWLSVVIGFFWELVYKIIVLFVGNWFSFVVLINVFFGILM